LRFTLPLLIATVWSVLCASTATAADDLGFRNQVAPILERRCLHCHGDIAPKGGLSLVRAQALLEGGESGPAVVPGNTAESILLDMITGNPPAMPKKEESLTKGEIAAIKAWIERGAIWPTDVVLHDRRFEGKPWWSFEPLSHPRAPAVKSRAWARTPIDTFILAKLEANGLKPSPEADRRTLIRRLSFDLLGLPPTPDDVDAFVRDPNPDAYEALVDRTLANPGYGERWARHWLDVVHYGDTHGYDKDKRRDNAWPYRDYVIRSINADIPYGRFIREQVAGDVLWPGDPRTVIATGFIAAGPWDFVGNLELREGTIDKLKTQLLDRDDMVSTTISTFVSLTVHCARCHDHKFDPIPQKDYYRLQAVFAGVDRGDRPYPSAEVAKPMVYALRSHPPRPIQVLRRGEVDQPLDVVDPGTLSCVKELTAAFACVSSSPEGDRRSALANWLSNSRNPLTWRSIANRVWYMHFGRGIVDTPNDFGRNGGLPTHPELLDWMAAEIREGHQSLKSLHRLIVTSAVYRQASTGNSGFEAIDADNRLLWRQNRRRLDAESIRDSVLAIAGRLDRRMGGPGFELFRFKDDHSPIYDHSDPDHIDNPSVRRRTVYRFVVRSVPNPLMEALDCADPNLNTPVRSQTLTALQSLALWNDLLIIRQSKEFARRLEQTAVDPKAQVDAAYRLALGRLAKPHELEALSNFAAKYGLPHACRVLWNTNEFVFID
jgi:hypothetical protein